MDTWTLYIDSGRNRCGAMGGGSFAWHRWQAADGWAHEAGTLRDSDAAR